MGIKNLILENLGEAEISSLPRNQNKNRSMSNDGGKKSKEVKTREKHQSKERERKETRVKGPYYCIVKKVHI